MVLEVASAALAAELTSTDRRGTYLALFGCCFGTGYGIGPIVAGLLLDWCLPHVIWAIQLVAAASGALSLLVLVTLKKRSERTIS
jgi:MFS family permease